MTTCGNGTKEGPEACDDGNLVNGDGCSSTCTIETGFNCNTVPNPNVCSAICGDSMKYGTEVCDDGNTINSDGCNSVCSTIENGWTCTTPAGGKSVCTALCSTTNPYVVGPYTCSDNDSAGSDGCDGLCQIEPGWSCTTALGSFSVCSTKCGDGTKDLPEACDDGDTDNGDGCSSTC